jgi:hypothetical protein
MSNGEFDSSPHAFYVDTHQAIRWTVILIVGMWSSYFMSRGWVRHAEAIEAVAAMEHGYVQAETWSGKIVWQRLQENVMDWENTTQEMPTIPAGVARNVAAAE